MLEILLIIMVAVSIISILLDMYYDCVGYLEYDEEEYEDKYTVDYLTLKKTFLIEVGLKLLVLVTMVLLIIY